MQILKWSFASVLIVLLIILISPFLRRYVFLNIPDVYDYNRLPSRVIEQDSKKPHYFAESKRCSIKGILPFDYEGQKVSSLDSLLRVNNTTAFIVIRNDTVMYEKYFNGHKRGTFCKSFSASKNVISALTGIALDEGLIADINDPVTKYLPGFTDNTSLAKVTIKHCLDATAGFPANNGGAFPWHDNVKVYYSHNLPALLSKLNCETEPGKSFRTEEYSSCLLALVLEEVTGKSVSDYLSEKIWKPMGMEYNALWVLDRKDSGHEVAMSGLTARAIDFARFGSLYLHKGEWNGRQIISEDWVRKTTSPDNTLLSRWDGGYYNSTWWGKLSDDGSYEYSANGHYSQRIYIAPVKNAVVVRFGPAVGDIDWSMFISALISHL